MEAKGKFVSSAHEEDDKGCSSAELIMRLLFDAVCIIPHETSVFFCQIYLLGVETEYLIVFSYSFSAFDLTRSHRDRNICSFLMSCHLKELQNVSSTFTNLDAELPQLPAFGLAAQYELYQQRGLVGQCRHSH